MAPDYLPPSTLNGNIKIVPISLNTISRLKPRIRKGNNNSHTMGSTNIIISASGQHNTNKIHHRRIAIIVLIQICFANIYKRLTNFIMADFKVVTGSSGQYVFTYVQCSDQKCTFLKTRI